MKKTALAVAVVCALAQLTVAADARPRQKRTYETAQIIGARPAGCPRRYCGCEASLYLWGVIKPRLNLAANWIRDFPRATPRPGMAAARNGHVMILVSHVSGYDWVVHDGNSGGGLTRIHVRDISRYVVVDPNGSRVARR